MAAETARFDRLAVSDHVVFGQRLDDYSRPDLGGVKGGRQPTGPDGHWLEPLTLLSHLSGCTSTIRLRFIEPAWMTTPSVASTIGSS